MAFFRTASVPIIGTYQFSGKFSKIASQNEEVQKADDKYVRKALNLLSEDTLRAISRVYNISSNFDDYIFPIPRALTADVPNNNSDCFTHEELIRFSDKHRCAVFETFRNDPLHVEHVAHDPKAARGYLPDVYYMQGNQEDRHVVAVAAVDIKKDPALGEGILSGDIDSFSMGCICEAVQCSHCGKVANSDLDLCDHVRLYKGMTIDGSRVYEKCLGVEFQELSVVGVPADPTATTQALLRHEASNREKTAARESFRILNSLVNAGDAREIARYVRANINTMPEAMLNLFDKLL